MTDKQKKAADIYLINGLNKTQAMIEAGYSAKFANGNVSGVFGKDDVKEYIRQQQEKSSNKLSITRQMILERQNKRSALVDELQRLALLEEPTLEDLEKFARLSSVIKVSDGNKSDEILVKMLGFNEPEKSEIKHTWDVGFGEDEPDEEEEETEED